MNTIGKVALVSVYIGASVAGLATLRHFLPKVAFPLRWDNLPPVSVRAGLIVGGGLYVFSFGLWLLILRAVPLAVAYPAAVGLTICGSTAVSVLLLGERIHLSQAFGIVLVLLGVMFVVHKT